MKPIDQMVLDSSDAAEFAVRYFDHLRALLDTIDPDQIRALVRAMDEARRSGSTIFVAGNGGSATTATSMANDLGFDVLKKSGIARTFRVLALTDSNAAITAMANDVGYESIFTNQLRIHYREGDLLLVISASGNSPNVVEAAEWVKEQGGTVIGFLGFTGGKLGEICDVSIHAASGPGEYGPVEDAHLVMNHVLAHWFQVRLREGS